MAEVWVTRGAEQTAAIDALERRVVAAGGARVGIASALRAPDGLGRRARRTFAPHPRLLGRTVVRALTWEAADRRDERWWPQGITWDDGVLAVAWYSKAGHGSRFSLLDPERRRYDHVLLVQPDEEADEGLRPLKVHAGGLLWHGDWMHVAATARGFLSCRTDDLLRVPDGFPGAHGHRYLLPVRLAHHGEAEGVEKLRFSFFSLDRSGDVPVLLAGEYGGRGKTHRLARFGLDPATALPLLDDDGRCVARTEDAGLLRMQGVAVADGILHVVTSEGRWHPGTLRSGAPGRWRRHRWATPMGPEDLTWWPASGLLWTPTEHPRQRWVLGLRPDAR